MQKGMPAPDRPWAASDYEAAVKVLSALSPDQLPQTRSKVTGSYVARLTAQENLEILENTSLPVAARMTQAVTVMQAGGQIAKLYVAATMRDPRHQADMLRTCGFNLRTAATAVPLVEQFFATLDKADPSYPNRLKGLSQMKGGVSQMLQGTLTALAEQDDRDIGTARVELAESLARAFPTLATMVPPLSKDEFVSKIQRMADKESNGEVKAALVRTLGNR